ncbi:galactokinase [Pseudomonadales bacterium]|nr:galactokinase [Pseudomonadales bacterium]
MKSEQLRKKFSAHFGREPEKIVKAPGRVNLIGEHTDYNEGFVLPCAIDYCTLVAVMKRDDRQIQVLALDWSDETDAFSLDEEIKFHPDQMWSNYIRGVVRELKLRGYPLQGCNIAVTGNVPQGAGLSSSAALEVAVTVALVAAANGSISETQSKDLQLDRLTIAQIGQAAENNFVGCACGIMDQLISSSGVDGHALLIDCQDYQLTPVVMPDELSIVIVNSNVRRGLVDSEYNQRRAQCETVASHFDVPSLRYLDEEKLQSGKAGLDSTTLKRAEHVIGENRRVLSMVSALNKGDCVEISRLMAQSHESMKSLFEITIPAIDQLVSIVASVIGESGGVRMTGGGFGGCVVALVPHDRASDVADAVEAKYEHLTGLKATIYPASPSAGVSLI